MIRGAPKCNTVYMYKYLQSTLSNVLILCINTGTFPHRVIYVFHLRDILNFMAMTICIACCSEQDNCFIYLYYMYNVYGDSDVQMS